MEMKSGSAPGSIWCYTALDYYFVPRILDLLSAGCMRPIWAGDESVGCKSGEIRVGICHYNIMGEQVILYRSLSPNL